MLQQAPRKRTTRLTKGTRPFSRMTARALVLLLRPVGSQAPRRPHRAVSLSILPRDRQGGLRPCPWEWGEKGRGLGGVLGGCTGGGAQEAGPTKDMPCVLRAQCSRQRAAAVGFLKAC